jgi:hypothetical protein
MKEKPVYLKSMHHYQFRHNIENPRVIGFVSFKPENLNPRLCYKVEYDSDNKIDYIAHSDVLSGHWEINVD